MQNPRSRFPPAAVVAAVLLLTTRPVQCAEAGDFSRQTTKQRTDDGRVHEDACSGRRLRTLRSGRKSEILAGVAVRRAVTRKSQALLRASVSY
jgi:hypothetical protein